MFMGRSLNRKYLLQMLRKITSRIIIFQQSLIIKQQKFVTATIHFSHAYMFPSHLRNQYSLFVVRTYRQLLPFKSIISFI